MWATTDVECEACKPDAVALKDIEIQRSLKDLPEWTLHVRDGIPTITRSFEFDDFAKAITFTMKVGELSEEHGHHPEIITEWGRVQVTWWSHKIQGLHEMDFKMASACDSLI